jgi:DNA-binding LacI/PurR family transcriptional regulator
MAKVTIIDIARRAGVGVGTASRALNNAGEVSAATRERVLAAAAELNYHPDALARRLQGKRSNVVAYVPEVGQQPASDMHFKDFIAVLAESCGHHDLDLLVHPLKSERDYRDSINRLLVSRRADGLILADTRLHDERIAYLTSQQLPFVAFGRTLDQADYPFVDLDSQAGTAAATAHLIEGGHTRIAYLSMPPGYTFAHYRYEGYRNALHVAGLPFDQALVAANLATETDTRQHVQSLMRIPKPPTALVAATDLHAIYAMRALEDVGFIPGRDVAIVGFDDLPLAAHTRPTLTTVRQRFDAICDLLITTLIGVIDGDEKAPRQSLVQPEFVIRQSSGQE